MRPLLLPSQLILYPPYPGAGIRLVSLSNDYRELQDCMKLRFYNRTDGGAHFGGRLSATVDFIDTAP
ncbi:MAG: hypothetical protein PVJ53_05770 [Desulfobacterales bacterium]|jgi:hypothetical protein